MKYQTKRYINDMLEVARFSLASMVSIQATIAVLCTGIYGTHLLRAFGVSQHIADALFISCAMYFAWAFLISAIDRNIERDVL